MRGFNTPASFGPCLRIWQVLMKVILFFVFLNALWESNLKSMMLNFMSTNSPQMKFPSKSDAEKLLHLPSSPLSWSPLLLPAAPLSLTPPLLSSPLLSPAPLFSSPLLSTSSVLSVSPLGSLSSFRLSDLSRGSSGLIYSPNILNRTCAHAQKKIPAHIFHQLPDPECILGYIHPVRIKARAVSNLATCTFATNLCLGFFSTPSLRLTLSHSFTDSMDFIRTQSKA